MIHRAFAVAAISICLSGAAAAAELESPSTDQSPPAQTGVAAKSPSDWEFTVTPYLWLAGVHADIAIPRDDTSVSVDKSFADLLANLKFGFMGAFDVRHRRFVATSDIMYMNVGVSAKPKENPDLLTATVGTKLFLGSLLAGYRVVDQDGSFVDLLAGGRVESLDFNVKLKGPLETRVRDLSPSNVSPLLGARARLALSKSWGVGFYTDFGGIVSNADIRWQAVGMIQHDLSSRWRMALGWRNMHIKHSQNDGELKMNLAGPLISFSYRL